jgi:hypothetical protein
MDQDLVLQIEPTIVVRTVVFMAQRHVPETTKLRETLDNDIPFAIADTFLTYYAGLNQHLDIMYDETVHRMIAFRTILDKCYNDIRCGSLHRLYTTAGQFEKRMMFLTAKSIANVLPESKTKEYFKRTQFEYSA